MLVLSSVKLQVSYINYENHEIVLNDPENCLPHKFLQINDSLIHPYKFDDEAKTSKLSFFNCSSVEHQHLRNYQQSLSDSQDMISCPIYVSDLHDSVLSLDLTSCTKMFDIVTPVSAYGMQRNSLDLRWSEANCSQCKAKGKKLDSLRQDGLWSWKVTLWDVYHKIHKRIRYLSHN
ncbi:hypothetical protein JHK85_048935 [Glycine max]|nr:hypothetical protein JHK85_048935 [Glycine max]